MTVVKSVQVLIGVEPEDVYRLGDEVVISGHMRLYADEVPDLVAALTEIMGVQP